MSEKVGAQFAYRALPFRISRQDYTYIQTVNPSKLLTNLTGDVDSIEVFVSQAIISIASSVFMIVGCCVLLLSIDWKLGLVVLTIIPFIGVAFGTVLRKVHERFSRRAEKW